MKTHVLKMVLPFMAFFMAIAFAFAFDGNSIEASSLSSNYIYQNKLCVATTVQCNNIGDVPCTDGLLQVWEKYGTFCADPMTHRP